MQTWKQRERTTSVRVTLTPTKIGIQGSTGFGQLLAYNQNGPTPAVTQISIAPRNSIAGFDRYS